MIWFVTPPLQIIDIPADRYHYSWAVPMIPRRIVMHATAGVDSREWLSTASEPPVSCHRLIDRNGVIYKIVENHRIAFHVGFAEKYPYPNIGYTSANYTSLGIELENLNDGKQDYPTLQLASAANQVVEWYGAYGYLPVVSHADMDARKRDPANFPWNRFMGMVWERVTRFTN